MTAFDPARLLTPELVGSLALIAVFFQGLRLWRGARAAGTAWTAGAGSARRRGGRVTSLALLAALAGPFVLFAATGGVSDLGQVAAAPPGAAVTLTKNLTTQFQAAGYRTGDATLTITPAVTANAAAQTVTVSNTTNVTVGTLLAVDSGASLENIVVSAVPTATSITAIFSLSHVAGAAAVNTNVQFPTNTVQLVGTTNASSPNIPAAAFASGSAPAIGRGGHAIQGQNGKYLIIAGGCTATWSVYDASANTFTAGSPALTLNVCTGAFSAQLAANTFLLVAGGRLTGSNETGATPLATLVVTATATGFTFAAGPSLAGATGAGAGAHAIARGDGNLVIVHGGGTTLASFVSGGATPAIAAGPTGLTAVGDGALSLPRTVDTKWFLLTGGGSRNTFLYDQTTSPGTFTAATAAPTNYGPGAGAHAIQYTDAACNATAPNTCYRVVVGAAGTRTATYNPQSATTATLTASGTTTAAVGTGAFSIAAAATTSTFLTFRGGATNGTNTFTAGTLAAGPALPGSLGIGAFALQRPDGDYLVFLGNGTSATALYDAGFRLLGTYTTEPLDPTNVDRWTELDWTKTADLGITLNVRTATTSAGLGAAAYTAVATSAATSGTFALSTTVAPVANKWAQVQTVLSRGIPQQGGAWANVWGGSGVTAFQRAPSANPTLSVLSLKYVLPEFLITATTPQTAGTPFTATITLKDEAGAAVTDYTGTHTLTFAGANPAPDTTAPAVTDASAVDQAFGAATTVTFASGVGSPTVKLYRAEGPITITATEATGTGSTTTYTLTTATILSTGATLTVAAGATSAATSLVAAVPVTVIADNSTTSTVTVTLRDGWQNLAANRTVSVTLASSRGATDTFGQPSATATDASGNVTGTIRSGTLGTPTISATAGGTPLTATTTVTFVASRFVVTTQHTGTETANVAFTVSLKATDLVGTTDTTLNGNLAINLSWTATARTTPKAGPAPVITATQTAAFSKGLATLPSTFTLMNSGQTPTITAADAGTPGRTGTSTAITILVNVIDAANSELAVTPTPPGCLYDACVPADGTSTATVTVRLYDAVSNPLSSRTVTISSSRGVTDIVTQPAAQTDANGVATGSVKSGSTGNATMSATGAPKEPTGQQLPADSTAVTVTQTKVVHFSGTHFVFTLNAPASGTSVNAGVGFTMHLVLQDETGNTITTYSGAHTLLFTTTATARTTPASGPAATIPSPQTITFTSGAGDTLAGSQFVLFNSGETPTISASEGSQFLGATPNLTVVPAAASLTASLMSSNPASQTANGVATSAITATVTDAFHNPRSGFSVTINTDGVLGSCGTCETLSPSAGVTQPATGTTDVNGNFVATATSKSTRIATYTAVISGTGGANGTLTATAQVSWGNVSNTASFSVQVVFPNPPYAAGATRAVAGQSFQIVVTALKSSGAADLTYCTTSCSLTLTHTASTAPDGVSAPTPASGTAVAINSTNGPFVNGVWTSSTSFVTFYAAQTARTITVTNPGGATGTSAAFDVLAAATSPSVSIVIATPRTVPADGAQASTVRARVTDAYRNPEAGLAVTFASDLTGSTWTGTTTQTSASDGMTPTIALTSTAAGLANVSATIPGPVSLTGTTVQFAAAAARIALGSYYGSSTNGTLTKFPLEVTAVCNGTCTAPNVAGEPLPDATIIQWSYTSSNGGTGLFDSSAGFPTATTANTTGAYGSATHKTAFQVTRVGSFCIQAQWQNPDASFTTVNVACGTTSIVGMGIFDLTDTETTSGNNVTTRARAVWDGATLRIIGWSTDR